MVCFIFLMEDQTVLFLSSQNPYLWPTIKIPTLNVQFIDKEDFPLPTSIEVYRQEQTMKIYILVHVI